MADFDTTVKLAIYQTIADKAHVPTAGEVANSLGSAPREIESAYQDLAKKRLLFLEPGTSDRIRMAPPFSGVPTPHTTKIDDKTWYANCAWDAFGVAAALHRDADIFSTCPDCDELLAL